MADVRFASSPEYDKEVIAGLWPFPLGKVRQGCRFLPARFLPCGKLAVPSSAVRVGLKNTAAEGQSGRLRRGQNLCARFREVCAQFRPWTLTDFVSRRAV